MAASNSRSYYAQYDIWLQDGTYKRPPEALSKSVIKFVEANQLPYFEIGDPAEKNFLSLASAHGVVPKRVFIGKFHPKRTNAFAFYLLGGMDNVFGFVDKGFDTQHPLFDRQIECSRETHLENSAWAYGCGNQKRQQRKICIYDSSKLAKRDFFRPALWPYCNQRILVVTRRVRDALVEAGLTGFELKPVLDGRIKWSARQLEYDYDDEVQEREAAWFQLTVTKQNVSAIPLTEPLGVPVRAGESPVAAETCPLCNHSSGNDFSSYKAHEKIHARSRFSEADLQAWDWFEYLGRKLFVDNLTAMLVVSSRFVDLVERHGFKGIARGPKHLRYQAMLVKEEIEVTLGLDQIATYPVAG